MSVIQDYTQLFNARFPYEFFMNLQLEINSFSVSKNSENLDVFEKYDIDVAIEETENMNEYSKFKYQFTIMSNPKNIRYGVEGIVKVNGSESVRIHLLDKNENSIPNIMLVIYQELYPTIFLLSKSLNIPCPPYTFSSTTKIENDMLNNESELASQVDTNTETMVQINENSQDVDSIEQSQSNSKPSEKLEEITT